ncbi:MAG: DUF3794 domain-containing protein [bacterium]|nr:DUF3794 domain-containing protein [bacterium]
MDHMDQQMEKTGTKTPEVLREELPLQRLIGEGLSQAVVEGEVALPGGLREETHVLLSQAMAALDKSTVENGRVNAEGKVTFHVLYTQGDPTKVSALEASAEFSHPIELAGAQSGMQAPISMMVEHVEASAQGGRLHLMAILRLHARAFTDEPLSVVTGIRDMDGLMLRTETLSALHTASRGVQDVLVRDECELGAVLQITDTLCAQASVTVQEVMGGEGRATLSGQVLLEVMHTSLMPSRPLVVTRHTIPFEETIALTGESGDELCCSAVVRDVAVLSQEGQEEGERTLRAEVLLGLEAHATRSRDVKLLLDAYTTQGDVLTLGTQGVQRAVSHRQIHTAESGKLTLLTEGMPPVRTPLHASLRPVITGWSRQNGKLLVEGMMETTLLYMTDDSAAPQSYHAEEPFRMAFACDVSLPESMVLTTGNVESSVITSDRVEVKYILHLDCFDVQLRHEQPVTQVAAMPAPQSETGVLVCFAQQGEGAWEIAKRYRVSPELLLRMNPQLDESGAQPQRVVLWKR